MSYDLRSALGWITVIGVSVAVLSYVLSLAVTGATIAAGQYGPQLQSITRPLILWAFMVGFLTPPANAAVIIAGCLIIYAICFVKATKANGGFLAGLRLLSSGSKPKVLPNWLTVMPLLASALLVIDLLLSLLQDLFGVNTGSLGTTDPTVLLPSLALAPIAEEIGFRMSALWLFVTASIAFGLGRRIAQGFKMSISGQLGLVFSAFISPGYAKERAGLPSIRTNGLNGISTAEWIGLVITSVIFGLYHVLGGSGWGPGKFLTSALSGFALGIVYLAYGAYANILLHWFFDLYFSIFLYNGISGVLGIFGDLTSLGALALGVWGIFVGIHWLTRPKDRLAIPNMWQVV